MSKPVQTEETTTVSAPRSLKRHLPYLILIVVLGAGIGWWSHSSGEKGDMAGRKGKQTPTVSVAVAGKGDLKVMLDALGTVQANNTVTVKSRVDGQLLKLHFREGQDVKAGQLLAEIDPRPFQVQVTQAEGQLARDMAQLANARADLTRYKTLLGQNGASQQQVDTQEALVRQLAGTVKVDEGALAAARLQLTYSRITAPLSGKAGLKTVDEGNMIHASDANGLVVITQVQPANVLFSIPETRLEELLKARAGNAPLGVDALDRDGTTVLAHGVLATMDNQVDTATGTVKLKARFDNKDEVLFPSRFVNARMTLATLHDVLVVPAVAVQRGKPGAYVFVVNADNTVSQRPVKTGPAEGERIVIREGLTPGERVVLDGLDQLRDGRKVNPVSAGEADKRDASAAHPGKKRKAG